MVEIPASRIEPVQDPMSDNDKSLGDQHTFDGEISDEADANSLGDEKTYAGGANAGPSSLGDEMTFGGDAAGLDDDLYDDQMEIVDLESRYTTEGVLGKGGMGEVLLATDTRLERKVAIKRILGKAARSRTAVNRFLTEAKSVAAINHPNIVQIYDYGRAKDGPFLIMECVEGNSLLDRCRQGAIPLDESIELIVQLCDGLAAAHDAHIIHRDIKPANILLTKNNIPKLTDFGLAKAEAADTGMTMAGAVLGTLDFMPPEQRKDAALVDQRSDLWSLAATLYQMVTGKSPKIIKFNDVPKELHDVLGKALEDEKDDRYQSARNFKDALLASRSGTAEVELAEGDCPHCGTKNPTNRKFCRNPDCSESLEVPCLSCQSGIPMWEQVCDSCGTPQHELLEQRRTQMASEQAETESLLKGLDFDRAKSMAVTLRDEPDLRLMHLKGWAERFLGEIEKGREQELARLAELMKEAVTHQQAHDYAAGLRTLEQVPKIVCDTTLPGHDQTVNALRKKLQSTLDEIERLDPLIRTRVKNRDLDGLLAEVEQLQRLQPGRDNLRKLADQLNKRDSKLATTRDEALAEAKKRLANQDYDGCLAQLNRIDESLVDADIESLKQAAETNRGQVNALRDGINMAVQGKQLDGLLPQVELCLALQAGAEDLQKLRDQLVERDSRNAALVAAAIQQAEQFRQACRFDQAVAALERISDGLATQPSDELLFECQSLHDNQTRAMQSMKRASETGEFNKPLAANETYQRGLSASGLHDPVFESASAACQQQLAARQESEQAARRQKALMIKLGIGAAALVVVVVSVMVVLSVQKGMRATAFADAVRQGRWDEVLQKNDQHVPALIGRASQRLKKANPDIAGGFADIGLAEQLGASDSALTPARQLLAVAHANRAASLATAGEIADAEKDLKEAETLGASDSALTPARQLLAVAHANRAASLATAGEIADAEKDLKEAETLGASDSALTPARQLLAVAYVKQLEQSSSDANLDAALAAIVKLPESGVTATSYQRIGAVLLKRAQTTITSDLSEALSDYIAAIDLGMPASDSQVLRDQLVTALIARFRQSLAGLDAAKALADYASVAKLDGQAASSLAVDLEKLPASVLSEFPPSSWPVKKNSLGMTFKLLPGGTFTRGESSEAHQVTLTQSFELGVYEVTQEQYEAVMGTNPSYKKGPQKPVDGIGWDDAVEFCRRLSAMPAEKKSGYAYRLPTEAEWEYACRAGTTTTYSFGDSDSELDDYAWHSENSGNTNPQSVGSKKPNPWGLHDMHGNVWEWCQDWYGDYPSGSVTDPTGPATPRPPPRSNPGSKARVVRGGSYGSSTMGVFSATRAAADTRLRNITFGFRVARTYNLSR